ncbi:MAG TPA: polyhydroxyalkanoic acid system family protein [Pirellulales bacterium]|nr:polyhydroxyalkanoic acid system family protein [Pirellulales bacterium]
MPKITVNVPHELGQQVAAERLQSFVTRLKEKHQDQVSNLEEEWSGNSLKFRFKTFGFQFQGTGNVSDTDATLDVDIPFAAMMFKGKIESEMRDTLTRVLRS